MTPKYGHSADPWLFLPYFLLAAGGVTITVQLFLLWADLETAMFLGVIMATWLIAFLGIFLRMRV